MLVRKLVMAGLLACVGCAAGEELDLSNHDIGGANGSAGTTPAGAAGVGSSGESSSGTGVGNGGASVGGSGQSGSGGSGGGSQKDASSDGTASGGAAGAFGAGGAAGASGTGGSAGATQDAAADRFVAAGFSVLYLVMIANPSSAYVECELHAKNSGASSAPVSALKVRYYFTDEVHKTPQLIINWSHVTTAGANGDLTVTPAIVPLVPTATGADTYIEFGLSSGHPTLATGESADFSFRMNGPNPATDIYTQSNDYSFDSSKTVLAIWDHVVLVQNGTVIWGAPP